MQKVLVTTLFFLTIFLWISESLFATTTTYPDFVYDSNGEMIPSDSSQAQTIRDEANSSKNSESGNQNTTKVSKSQTVIVSEKVPGADCKCIWATAEDGKTCISSIPVTQRKYKCTIEPGLAGFQQMLATIIRWFVNIVMLAGVLAIVGLGIAWSLAGGDDAKAKSELKKWGMNIFVGMIILFFFRYILQFLAPWIYQ